MPRDRLVFNMIRRTLLSGCIPHKALKVHVREQNKTVEYILVHKLTMYPLISTAEGSYRLNVYNEGKESIIVTTDDIPGHEKIFAKQMLICTLPRGGKIDVDLEVVDGVGPYLGNGNAKFRTVNCVSFRPSELDFVVNVENNGEIEPKKLCETAISRLKTDLDLVVEVVEGKESSIIKYNEDETGFTLMTNFVDKNTIPYAIHSALCPYMQMLKIVDPGPMKPWVAIIGTCDGQKEKLLKSIGDLKARIADVKL